MSYELFDVVAVSMVTDKVRVLGSSKSKDDADAIVAAAVMRCGIESEFFCKVHAGSYQEGDIWEGKK
jgi:hypothetical protein